MAPSPEAMCLRWSHHRCRETTIDYIRTSGAEARSFRRQEHGEAGDVVESHIAALGLLHQRIEAGQSQCLFVYALLRADQIGVGESWTDCVDANGGGTQFERRRLGQVDDPGFG